MQQQHEKGWQGCDRDVSNCGSQIILARDLKAASLSLEWMIGFQ